MVECNGLIANKGVGMGHNNKFWLLAAASGLLLTACHKGAPSGQVVARVNGEEITQTELNAELAAAGVPPAARDKAGSAMIQRMVERKLLAQAAKKDGTDKDPTYILLRQQGDEALLVQRYLQRQSQTANQPPSDDEVQEYIRNHPALTNQRQQLALDQVQFPAPTDETEVKALQKVASVDELLNVLKTRNIQFKRDASQADTATVPDNMLASINRLKPGEPLVILGGPVITAIAVTGRQPVPINIDQAVAVAKQRIISERVSKRLQQESTALRQGADIQYGKGMAPPAKPNQ